MQAITTQKLQNTTNLTLGKSNPILWYNEGGEVGFKTLNRSGKCQLSTEQYVVKGKP